MVSLWSRAVTGRSCRERPLALHNGHWHLPVSFRLKAVARRGQVESQLLDPLETVSRAAPGARLSS